MDGIASDEAPLCSGIFSKQDAKDIAQRLASKEHARNVLRGVKFTPDDVPSVQNYVNTRQSLGGIPDVSLLGFRLFDSSDDILSESDAQHILEFCKTVQWEKRRGSNGRELAGTERKNFGVEMDAQYHVVGASDDGLPPLLDALGQRVLAKCKAQPWPFAKTDIHSMERFEQAYIQTYPPGCAGATASTLGFHFDSRAAYGELICGVSICGSAKFLLAATNGGEFINDAVQTLRKKNVKATVLKPRSLYAMTGLARYDLRHAVINDGDEPRVSITFRHVDWRKARIPRTPPRAPASGSSKCPRTATQPVCQRLEENESLEAPNSQPRPGATSSASSAMRDDAIQLRLPGPGATGSSSSLEHSTNDIADAAAEITTSQELL
jgi:alkylated DNA repair dioxygenase AlkB